MTSESEPSTAESLSPSKKERDATVEAVNHLIQGKRHLLVQDISSAVNSLQEACQILASCYGELANECADAYYHYGVALLELSRKESGILGSEKGGSDSGDSEEEEEEDDDEDEEEEESGDEEKTTERNDPPTDEVIDEKEKEGGTSKTVREQTENIKAGEKVTKARDDNSGTIDQNAIVMMEETAAKDSEAKSEDLDDSRKADEEGVSENKQPVSASPTSPNVNNVPSSTSAEVAVSKPSTSKEELQVNSELAEAGTSEEKPAAGEEDVSTLQLAWEVLELAKVIYQRQSTDNREMQLRLAQVHLKLGEVAMESESYKQSIEDMLESCKILQELLPADDRAIAEVYYQLGLSYTFDLQFDVAIDNFNGALKVLKDRVANLEIIIKAGGENGNDDAVYNAKREVEEISELLPEILEKISDTEDLKKNALKLPEELNKGLVPEKCEEELQVTTNSPLKEVKPVSSIAHLVRKKRKPEEVCLSPIEPENCGTKRSRADCDSEKASSLPHVNGAVEVVETNAAI